MTTNLELHGAIDSPELHAALQRFAERERRARDDREALVVAQDAFNRADAGDDPDERQRAATAVATCRVLVESSCDPRLDGEGLGAMRAALEGAQRYCNAHVDFEPPSDDPRDKPRPLKPKHHDLSEQVARAQIVRAAFRASFDEWWRDPSRFSYERTVRLLAEASRLCDLGDEVRALATVTV
jgi:hypothetical protein